MEQITTVEQVKAALVAEGHHFLAAVQHAAARGGLDLNSPLEALLNWKFAIRQEADFAWGKLDFPNSLVYCQQLHKIAKRIAKRIVHERQQRLTYLCPECQHVWEETWTAKRASDCPKCEMAGVLPESKADDLDPQVWKRLAAGDIRCCLFLGWENTEPARKLLAVVKEFSGKKITPKFHAALAVALPDAIVRTNPYPLNTAEIEWGGYGKSGGRRGGRALIARQDKNVVLDAAFLERENVSYYAAADERNAERLVMLGKDDEIVALANAMVDKMVAERKMNELLGVFGVAKYSIEEAVLGKE